MRKLRKVFIVEANLTQPQPESQQKSYLGWTVHCLLEEKKVSPAELARRLNVKRSAISHWINGTNAFTINNLRKVLKALEIDFIDFAVEANRSTSWGKFRK